MIIVNEEPNAEEAKGKVKEYEEANKSEIVIRQSQRADEERMVADRIAAQRREAERLKMEHLQDEKAIQWTKQKWKQESTQVLLGEREEVSAELRAAQMHGYRTELQRQQRQQHSSQQNHLGPRVREPPEGLLKQERKIDRELYRKRQAAGGGIPSGSIASHERNWTQTVSSLLSHTVQI
eukprot:scaffold12069_cov54-Attheya_sp.AAC.2